ncbi:MAG TPA: hypothetical protein VFV99_10625, partial [Kofleriaceae bacterium]|nr:hypothetical protein [Kofleriaceae bacterium]
SQQPKSNPPTSNPPTSQQRPVTPRPAPQASTTSGSFVVPPRRPIGLMVVVLLVDLGLAATGGVLLSKGLASKDEKKSEPKSEPAPVEKKSELETHPAAPAVPAAAVAPAPATSAATAVIAAAPAAEPKPNVAARESPKRDKAATHPTKPDDKPVTKPDDKPITKPDDKPVTKPAEQKGDAEVVAKVPAQPQDPYQAPNTEQEIDAVAARSSAAFARCAAAQSAHGSIKIAFQVRYDGRVINAAAVENTTNNADLARCLVTEISSWHVSAHNGTTINMLRPFTYP